MVPRNVTEAGWVLQSVWPGRTFWEQIFLRGCCLTLHFSRFLPEELGRKPWGAWLPVIHSCSSGICMDRNFPVLCNQPVWPNPQNPEADQLNKPHIFNTSPCWDLSPLPRAVPSQTLKHNSPIADSTKWLLSPCPGTCRTDVHNLCCALPSQLGFLQAEPSQCLPRFMFSKLGVVPASLRQVFFPKSPCFIEGVLPKTGLGSRAEACLPPDSIPVAV